jgi:transcriptional regulator with XRE-family HTH domain
MSDSWFFDVLPYRPQPYDDECLSGYLLRLAAANDVCNFRAFVQSLFPAWHSRRQVHVLRWEYPVDSWGALPLRLQLPVDRLAKMTLLPWVAKFRTPPVRTGIRQLSPGQILRGLVHPTLQACPLCLQEQPYRRLLWRLQLVVACLEHGCWLQGTCHGCGERLPVVDSFQRHLRCGQCGADLRQLPDVLAPDEVLAEEARLQPEWQFLLDPTVSLVGPSPEEGPESVSERLGLKLRYLRKQRGESAAQYARNSNMPVGNVLSIERGKRAPLVAYLAYLNGASLSWRKLASFTPPATFVSGHSQPLLMSLRVCPRTECSHHPTSSLNVTLVRNLPDQHQARFRCKACGLRFTRAYTGELVTKPRIPEGETRTYSLQKPEDEITRARQLGLLGESDRAVARKLGWTVYNAFSCWRVLGIYDEVLDARRRRREQEKQQRSQALRERVDAILVEFCQKDEPITLSRVERVLKHDGSFLRIGEYPEIAGHVRTVAQAHRAQCRQQRVEQWRAQIEVVIARYQERDMPLTIHRIAAEVGLTYWQLRDDYPELMVMTRQAVRADREMRRNNQIAQQCLQISKAATHLGTQGDPLTKARILTEARKQMSIDDTVPQVQEWLKWWTGDFGARD